jgi:hypothetical protein
MNTNETVEVEKKSDLRQPFIALSIALSLVIVRYIDSIVHDLNWLVSGLIAGVLAGVFAKIILSFSFFRRPSSKTFNRIFLVCIFIFIMISYGLIAL